MWYYLFLKSFKCDIQGRGNYRAASIECLEYNMFCNFALRQPSAERCSTSWEDWSKRLEEDESKKGDIIVQLYIIFDIFDSGFIASMKCVSEYKII